MSYQVRLLRRMGQNPAGSVRLYSDSEAAWLVGNGFGEYFGGSQTAPAAEPEVDQAPPADPHDEQRQPAPSLADLKAEAERLGLPTYGTKAQLADRIDQHKATLEQGDDEPDDSEDDLDDEDDD
ncbi:SAP domain-containing protein [Actinosynnema sp. NPDC004786]